jgi:phosphohistidine phosphatase SixA
MTLPEGLPVFFVRHGDYDTQTNRLTQAGIGDAERARDLLLAKGLGEKSLVLTTATQRAEETAHIIGDGLKAPVVTSSAEFTRLGSNPQGIVDLDRWLEAELADHTLRTDDVLGLTVVTHAPLVGLVRDLIPGNTETGNPPYGSVVPYAPGAWGDRYGIR